MSWGRESLTNLQGKILTLRMEKQMLSIFHSSVQVEWRGFLVTQVTSKINNSSVCLSSLEGREEKKTTVVLKVCVRKWLILSDKILLDFIFFLLASTGKKSCHLNEIFHLALLNVWPKNIPQRNLIKVRKYTSISPFPWTVWKLNM